MKVGGGREERRRSLDSTDRVLCRVCVIGGEEEEEEEEEF